MKKVISILSVLVLVIALSACESGNETSSTNEKKTEVKDKPKKSEKKLDEKKVEKVKQKKEKPKLSQEDIIKKKIKAIVKEQDSWIKVKEIKVNKNYGLNDGSYIVLPYLKWDAANTAKTTKKLLDMYSEDLAAKLAKETKISEITVFWEAPYLVEGRNIAKYGYSRSGKDMVKEEPWYDPALSE